MAKTENTKMTVTLDADSKRVLRNLTKAVNKLASRKWDETNGGSGVRRLAEDLEPGEAQLRRPYVEDAFN